MTEDERTLKYREQQRKYPHDCFTLDIPEDAWGCSDEFGDDGGHTEDPPCRMLRTVVIANCYMHLEAIRLCPRRHDKAMSVERHSCPDHPDQDLDVQHAVCDYGQQNLYGVGKIYWEGRLQTAEIFGHEYVLVATPHC